MLLLEAQTQSVDGLSLAVAVRPRRPILPHNWYTWIVPAGQLRLRKGCWWARAPSAFPAACLSLLPQKQLPFIQTIKEKLKSPSSLGFPRQELFLRTPVTSVSSNPTSLCDLDFEHHGSGRRGPGPPLHASRRAGAQPRVSRDRSDRRPCQCRPPSRGNQGARVRGIVLGKVTGRYRVGERDSKL
jgi:hypothetical protein